MANDHHPHDHYFKRALSLAATRLEFLEECLDPELKRLMMLDTAQPAPIEIISAVFGQTLQDILFKVQLIPEIGQDAYIYIHPEHISSDRDRWQIWRSFKASIDIAEQHRLAYDTDYLPLVHSIVYYHGRKSPYPHPLNIFDYYQSPNIAEKLFNNPLFIDTKTLDANAILQRRTRLGAMILANKELRNRKPLDIVKALRDHLQSIDHFGDDFELIKATIEYYLSNSRYGRPEDFEQAEAILTEAFSNTHSEAIMSFTSHIEARGIEQGIGIGADKKAHQIATNMLQKGSETAFISEVTGLPKAEIEALKDQHDN